MALIGTSACTGNHGSQYTLYLYAWENSTNVANNTSNVTIQVDRTRSSSNYTNHGYNNPTILQVDNVDVASATPVSAHNTQATQTLITWTGDISHNADGTKTIFIASSFSSSSSNLSGGYVSGNLTLSTIPRKTNCPSISGYIGESTTMNLSPASGSFWHRLYYWNNTYWQEIGTGTNSITWNIPRELANGVNNDGNRNVGLLLYTYSGDTWLGESQNTAYLHSGMNVRTACPSLSGNIGDTITINLNPYSSTYTHKLVYVYNNQEYIIKDRGYINGTSWTIPDTFKDYNTSGTTVSLPLRLYTYTANGSALNNSPLTNTGTFTMKASEIKPTINEITSVVDTNETTIALTGSSSKIVAFVSQVLATVDYTFKNNATLKNLIAYYEYVDGTETKYKELKNVTSGNTIDYYHPTSDMTNVELSSKVAFRVIDSRNQSSDLLTYDVGEDFIPYTPIMVLTEEIARPSTYSNKMTLNIAVEFWNGYFSQENQNELTIQWRVRENNGTVSAWQTFTDYEQEQTSLEEHRMLYSTGEWETIIDEDTQEEHTVLTPTPVEIVNPLSQDGNWNFLSRYHFELKVSDSVNEKSFTHSMLSAIPVYDGWQTEDGSNFFNVNGHYLQNNEYLFYPKKLNVQFKQSQQYFTQANEDYFAIIKSGYTVQVTMFLTCTNPVSTNVPILNTNLPKPAHSLSSSALNPHWQFQRWGDNTGGYPVIVNINNYTGEFYIRGGYQGATYFINFTYLCVDD